LSNDALNTNQSHFNITTKPSIKPKFFIKSYGCQMNVYDSDKISDILQVLGYEAIDSFAEADIVILNTCNIREKAAEKLYSDLGRVNIIKNGKGQIKANVDLTNTGEYLISDDQIEDSQIEDSQIEDSQIEDSQIEDSQIEDSQIEDSQIEDGKIEDSKITDGTTERAHDKHNKRKQNTARKSMIICVAGCVAQAEGEEIFKRAPYVDIVIGPQTYHRLPEMLENLARKNSAKRQIDLEFPVESKFDFLVSNEKLVQLNAEKKASISEFLSIQEGCDKFCKFCVVPYTRGPEYSRSVHEVISEAKSLATRGAKEITLLGQNVTAYHGNQNDQERDMGFLLFEIEKQIPNLKRLRYTTSHPRDMNEGLFLAHEKIKMLMPLLHLPVQSGSNKILKAMNRGHEIEMYIEIITKLRSLREGIAFSSDFIVGYPGETEEDFLKTMALVKTVSFSQAYSFVYSPRAGTPAAFLDQIEDEIKFERLYRLQDLLKAQQMEFNQSCVGKIMPVLIEDWSRDKQHLFGKTEYSQTTYLNHDNLAEIAKKVIGEVVNMQIISAAQCSVTGCLAL
jgi:tRNA-2-methylthio-N6-dimethylallyladenosine synthase